MRVNTPTEMRRIAALDLRLSGASYRRIARAHGCSVATAFKDVRYALRATMQEPADELRRLELARLDKLLFAVWPAAATGDVRACASVLRIMERRAALLGLDEPKRIDIAAYIREVAEREGIDPDEAVRAAEEIIRRAGW